MDRCGIELFEVSRIYRSDRSMPKKRWFFVGKETSCFGDYTLKIKQARRLGFRGIKGHVGA